MKKAFLVCMMIVTFVAGCVPSIHELYTDQDLIYEPALVGVWKGDKSDDGSWTFTAGDKEYGLVVTDHGKSGAFSAHLLKLKGTMFLDIYPGKLDSDQADFYKGHLIPAHSFMRVEQITPTLRLSDMDFDWANNFLHDHPTALAHETLDKQSMLLTASTPDLQRFILAHQNDEGAFKPMDKDKGLTRETAATGPAAKP